MNQGFTLYDAQTLKPVFNFNKKEFKIAGLKDYTIMDLSLLFETQRAVIVFDKQPKKVYFFDFINIRSPMVSRNTDEEIEEKERKQGQLNLNDMFEFNEYTKDEKILNQLHHL